MPRKKVVNTGPKKEKFIPLEDEIISEEEVVVPEEEKISEEEESLQLLGQQIREARITINLSLESVSGHLHIPVKTLQSIEDGCEGNLLPPVFLRGLVRSYCRFLGLENTGIIDKTDRLLKSDDENKQLNLKSLRPVYENRESKPIGIILTVLVLIVGGFFVYSFYFLQTPFSFNGDNETITEPLVVEVEPIIKPVQKSTPAIQESVSPAEPSPEIPEVSTEITLVEKKTESIQIIKPVAVQNTVEPLVLEVEASEDTWISIAVDKKETKDVRLETDNIQQWEAKKQYLLTLGNTHAVRVLLNGREIETDRAHQLLTDWVIDASLLP
jgi:cytoskeleton protein RodZ